MLFSERYGYKKVTQVLQVEELNYETKVGLWNVLTKFYWDKADKDKYWDSSPEMSDLISSLWCDYFKLPIDEIEDLFWDNVHKIIKNFYFSEEAHWYEVYDFIEFIGNCKAFSLYLRSFKKECNKVLERERTAYRFIGNHITSIVNDNEIKEVETALNNNKLKHVSTHLDNALELLSDRKNPDYRNSIKESISAVEGVARLISGNKKAELRPALKELEEKLGVEVHGALREGFIKIYGYTSDGDGIRHALTDSSTVNFEDAKFMLVTCSAFVNYLVSKAQQAEIDLS
ncbi:hypothetical protein PRVXH_000294 [Proteinivorax hydrogeniformans]|uniref:HEPN AbiJ-N-terminal domain-containing protein n=1 Tax=Proteinivorax hydrogeniformans TaxID=1826727 RepID=A0AAU8HUD7_9FIRM